MSDDASKLEINHRIDGQEPARSEAQKTTGRGAAAAESKDWQRQVRNASDQARFRERWKEVERRQRKLLKRCDAEAVAAEGCKPHYEVSFVAGPSPADERWAEAVRLLLESGMRRR